MSTNMPVLDRFLSYVKLDPSGCWLWTGGLSHNGYGRFKLNYRGIRAHRFSYAVFHGDIPDNVVIRHKCDTPACVNPFHLKAGTQLDNIKDRQDRDRQAKGSQNGYAKLDESKVELARSMLEMGALNQEVADFFGVGPSCISSIKLRKSWTHV